MEQDGAVSDLFQKFREILESLECDGGGATPSGQPERAPTISDRDPTAPQRHPRR
jgi:hypothetical protein